MNKVLYGVDVKFKRVCIRVKDMSNINFTRIDQIFSKKKFFSCSRQCLVVQYSDQFTMYIYRIKMKIYE
jgi:hypothetical protein